MEAGPKEEKPSRKKEYDSMGERRMGLDEWACCVGALLKVLHVVRDGYGGCRGLTGHHGDGCGFHHGGWGYPEVQNFQNVQWRKVCVTTRLTID